MHVRNTDKRAARPEGRSPQSSVYQKLKWKWCRSDLEQYWQEKEDELDNIWEGKSMGPRISWLWRKREKEQSPRFWIEDYVWSKRITLMCFVFRLTLYFYFANAAAHMKSQLYSLLLASIVPTLSRYLTFMCQIPTQSFPGGSVVKKKKSVCQCRRHGFELWSGKIPHAAEQLSLSAISIEPVL